jgi:hypothetical protein
VAVVKKKAKVKVSVTGKRGDDAGEQLRASRDLVSRAFIGAQPRQAR